MIDPAIVGEYIETGAHRDELILLHLDLSKRIAYGVAGRQDDDLASQAAFLLVKAVDSFRQVAVDCHISRFVYTRIRYGCLQYLMRRSCPFTVNMCGRGVEKTPKNQVCLDAVRNFADPPKSLSLDTRELLHYYCTDHEREIIALFVYGYTRAEIAAKLGVSPSTIGIRLNRALLKLRKKFDES